MNVKKGNEHVPFYVGPGVNVRREVAQRICDGKEHPSQSSTTGTVYICDPATMKHTFKRYGKVTSEIDIRFAPDGKTHTSHRTVFGADGKIHG